MKLSNEISEESKQALIEVLKNRFHKHLDRHVDLIWSEVEEKLLLCPDKLWSLLQMEETGGEPDVVGRDSDTGEFWFMDCSKETPKGRRSICYDREALEKRKEHKPSHSAMEMAKEMGIELLDEEQYRYLQTLGDFDYKSSSWIRTPDAMRKLGGGLFGDKRYDRVFIYHNGVESYYSSRGFRGLLRV